MAPCATCSRAPCSTRARSKSTPSACGALKSSSIAASKRARCAATSSSRPPSGPGAGVPRPAMRSASVTSARSRASASRRLGDALLGEVERVAVVRAEQVEAHGVGLVALDQLADRQRIAQRLRHLLGAEVEQPIVHPAPHEGLAGRALRLGDLALVVREDQVLAAPVQVERLAQVLDGHGRALDVPAGPTRSPRARPRRLAGLGALPEGEVPRVALALVDLDAGARDQLVEILARQPPIGGKPARPRSRRRRRRDRRGPWRPGAR